MTNILFLCIHNSARSILAESLLNHHAALQAKPFFAYSAGSSPRTNQQPHPLGLQALQEAGVDTARASSKSWDVYTTSSAPVMDAIITVCDSAAGEVCPIWPGNPANAHWGYADPSAGEGDDVQKLTAFRNTLLAIERRILRLLDLNTADLAVANLKHSLQKISTA